MLFDAHHQCLTLLGGIARRGIYDNMKTAVDKVGIGKTRDVNARFAAMASHYLFQADFCNPASGWEKGQIEKNVQDARHRIWHHSADAATPVFASLAALNDWLALRCRALWDEIHHPEQSGRTMQPTAKSTKLGLFSMPTLHLSNEQMASPQCQGS